MKGSFCPEGDGTWDGLEDVDKLQGRRLCECVCEHMSVCMHVYVCVEYNVYKDACMSITMHAEVIS